MVYLAWFDANPKKAPAMKIAEAQERYVEKFGAVPVVCLVNPADACDVEGLTVRVLGHIGRHCFWIGKDDE